MCDAARLAACLLATTLACLRHSRASSPAARGSLTNHCLRPPPPLPPLPPPSLPQARAISLKAVPMSLVMQGGSGKSYVMNLMDTPGGLTNVQYNTTVL